MVEIEGSCVIGAYGLGSIERVDLFNVLANLERLGALVATQELLERSRRGHRSVQGVLGLAVIALDHIQSLVDGLWLSFDNLLDLTVQFRPTLRSVFGSLISIVDDSTFPDGRWTFFVLGVALHLRQLFVAEALLIEFLSELAVALLENIIAFSVDGFVIFAFQLNLFRRIVLVPLVDVILAAIRLLVGLFQRVDRPMSAECLRVGEVMEALSRPMEPDSLVPLLYLAVIDVLLVQQGHDVLVAMRTDFALRFDS